MNIEITKADLICRNNGLYTDIAVANGEISGLLKLILSRKREVSDLRKVISSRKRDIKRGELVLARVMECDYPVREIYSIPSQDLYGPKKAKP